MSDITTNEIVTVETPKKKKRIFMWTFLAVQALFIFWIIAGMGGADITESCAGEADVELCEAASSVGTGIGVMLVVGLWMVVDFLMAVGYGVYRLAKRP